jgi:molecular chaperone GrpE (heat shock protein)
MARGWESKSVESQIEAADERTRARKNSANTEQMAIEQERASLELSRSRVLRDMESATHDGYKAIVQRSLDYLDQKLAQLGAVNKSDPRD